MDVENMDSSIINGHEWAQDLKKFLDSCTEKYFLRWNNVVIELGVSDQYIDKWVDIFKRQIEERYEDLVNDVIDMKAKVLDEISELLENAQKYANELGLQEVLHEINPKGRLYHVKKDLVERTEKLKMIMEERQNEIKNLMEKQKELCNILEKTPYELPLSPLPRKEEIENVQNYVDSLEQEKFNREERYLALKEAIGRLSHELDFVPKTDFERDILSETRRNFDITETNMKQLQKCHDDMVQQLASMKEEIDNLRSSIDELWNILEESMSKRHLFHEQYSGYTVGTLKALREEVKRCEELKKANIKVFVEKLRTELHELWRNCYHLNEESQANYQWLTSDLYTEDLLSYHELEVRKWRNFYTKNEKLIKLFAEHQELWNNLLEMENQDAVGPNRYKNRGGQLLKEEKERNKLSKKIPLIEEKIQQQAMNYEDFTGIPFMIFGTPIMEFIENLHTQRDQNRKIKLSARKQVREQETLLTPAKSCMSLFPSSSKMCLTPQTNSVKRKLLKPLTTGKRPKLEGFANSKAQDGFSSVEPERLRNFRRLSQEKAKKLKKCRKLLNMQKTSNNKENLDDTNATNYDVFESGIFSLQGGHRSTQYVPSFHK
ncbi:protein regulator of cytokinesis 1-like isoform X2 [Coccinella septempunctata]|uniref:protein regulator of cytokinesis 1-like isoform X2 n=1 Tax=Coccinella septempunctata TaxID=41139 RepID=UPI001D06FACC|nr:protein regulator of cytokinesis 1-like isoform X2 [Coccinella septempunctata]